MLDNSRSNQSLLFWPEISTVGECTWMGSEREAFHVAGRNRTSGARNCWVGLLLIGLLLIDKRRLLSSSVSHSLI